MNQLNSVQYVHDLNHSSLEYLTSYWTDKTVHNQTQTMHSTKLSEMGEMETRDHNITVNPEAHVQRTHNTSNQSDG